MTADTTTTLNDTTTNFATDSAFVGVQAETVHGDVHVYSPPQNASPAEKFEFGVHLLDGGMPGKARQLIQEAVMGGYTSNRVCFFWQLALVSGRTRHEMPDEDLSTLERAPMACRLTGGDVWADGVKTICRMLESARQPDADLRPLLKDFDGLADPQRSLILRHLELFLDGPLEDQMWHRALESAERDQKANGRSDHVWKFFEPKPVAPRVREARPPDIRTSFHIRAWVATVILSVAAIHIAYLLARDLQVAALLMYLLSLGGGYFAARNGLEWRFRVARLQAKDEEYRAPSKSTGRARPGGFAGRVDERFTDYFAKYVPRNTSTSTWLDGTAGIRKSLRDEIVHVYREQRIGVEPIAWLIRYRVSDVRTRWENGTLWSYRRELAPPPATMVMTMLGLTMLALGVARALVSAAQIAPLSTARSAAVALPAGVVATHAWLHIVLERRRYAADVSEKERTLKDCTAAFQRWQERLADTPSDPEMATWLDHDRKVLLNEALRHYGVAMSDMVAHAFIETRCSPGRRARVLNGPWRHERYKLLLFLLTTDGVRQFNAELDFARGTFHGRARTNYRYEAVAAVRVRRADDNAQHFRLTLVNGEAINVEVVAPDTEQLEGEEPGVVSEVTQDAANLRHTLNVMEGIAAEGKHWILRGRRRTDDRQTRSF